MLTPDTQSDSTNPVKTAPTSLNLAALRYRNFRLIWIGQFISFSGSMMQAAAILWHVSLLVPPSMKGLALGAVGLVRFCPILVFSVVSGVVADAVDRRKLMLITQSAMTLLALALAVLTFRGEANVWRIYGLVTLASAAGAFDGPARQSLVPTLVPREHLPNAISLNTIIFQLAAVLGPSLAGTVIATVGVEWVYFINALSFPVVIVALMLMRDVPKPKRRASISRSAAGEGLRFVFSSPIIRSTMLLDFFARFFSSATALLPIFAQDILKVGARGYGLLYAAPSVGALVASAVMIPGVNHVKRSGAVLLWSIAGYGAATIVFGLSRSVALTFCALAAAGATETVSMVLRNVIRQLETPDYLRGRMTGVNMAFFMGGPQLGELEAGLVAAWLGAPFSVVSGGVGCLIATWWVAAKTPVLVRYRQWAQPDGSDPD